MGRKSDEPIEKKKIALFEGDFERLGEILAARSVPPSVFIRHLVRHKLRQLEAALSDISKPVKDVEIDELIERSRDDRADDNDQPAK